LLQETEEYKYKTLSFPELWNTGVDEEDSGERDKELEHQAQEEGTAE
jgi:hypothetical protein